MKRIIFGVLVVALLNPAAALARGAGESSERAGALVSARGVGRVHLGDTVRSLHRRHLIGRLRPGCELDPGQRVARLRKPLNGFAIFSHPPNRVHSISILGGAQTAKGVTIGSSPGHARHAYPDAHYDPPGTFPPFEDGFFWVDDSENPRMTFTVDAESNRISELSVPSPSFCE